MCSSDLFLSIYLPPLLSSPLLPFTSSVFISPLSSPLLSSPLLPFTSSVFISPLSFPYFLTLTLISLSTFYLIARRLASTMPQRDSLCLTQDISTHIMSTYRRYLLFRLASFHSFTWILFCFIFDFSTLS